MVCEPQMGVYVCVGFKSLAGYESSLSGHTSELYLPHKGYASPNVYAVLSELCGEVAGHEIDDKYGMSLLCI